MRNYEFVEKIKKIFNIKRELEPYEIMDLNSVYQEVFDDGYDVGIEEGYDVGIEEGYNAK